MTINRKDMIRMTNEMNCHSFFYDFLFRIYLEFIQN